jgi:hypothetical protein
MIIQDELQTPRATSVLGSAVEVRATEGVKVALLSERSIQADELQRLRVDVHLVKPVSGGEVVRRVRNLGRDAV